MRIVLVHSRRNGVSFILSASPTQKPPSLAKGASAVPDGQASRAATRKRIADGVLRVAGVFLVPGRGPARAAVPCTLQGGKGRSAPCNPAFARTQPTARRSERRAARGWTACARAYHRAAPRYGLLRPSASAAAVESDSPGTVSARSILFMPGTDYTPASLRVKVRPELPGNFPLRGNLSHKFRSFPLDPLRRGGAARASRAKARRARRKSGAYARAAFAR